MGKIAADLERALARREAEGVKGAVTPRVLASGAGWSVDDVLCTSGPHDKPFEERHGQVCVAMVTAGAFEYRSPAGAGLMTPGAVMLGNAGTCFECGHRHHAGDRCVAFRYTPGYFEQIAADAGIRSREASFAAVRIPPLRPLAPLIAAACAGVMSASSVAWDELALAVAGQALRLSAGMPATDARGVPETALARIAPILRLIDSAPDDALNVERLAQHAGLSPYHFLRTFERVTGVTPHQYLLRARLRAAAQRLAQEHTKIVDIALDCGFNDVSNFNHAFRAEFGASPRAYRVRMRG
ncbi:helix-turn-helix transcriptional regulator [Trinickia violacea]|uniref:Helix-turn-helix transcriptional regulator n=1 Tax=Trinickia violacea TaxID=2571746 RepID=A0A4V1EH45_9BURK|nr:AraC family transcriptional regulator [Trinickia violacea]QCP48990.1 helix-turn-helix transcriptional regulator [Trinickia violacea]